MTCTDFDLLLCDYLDGVLPGERRLLVEAHISTCETCAELVRDSRFVMEFADRSAAIEPPPELVTRILYHAPAGGWFRQKLSRFFAPMKQPRYVMGAMMTLLYLSMMTRCAGVPKHPLSTADLDPVRIWGTLDDKVHRGWERSVKAYESMRLVYEVQSRVREWQEKQQEDEEESRRLPQKNKAPAKETDKK
jgi:hypothetical protein